MTTVGCFKCHKLMHKGDEAVECLWPGLVITRACETRPTYYVRYLCVECGSK